MQNTKPLFPNKYKIKDIEIDCRIALKKDIEIYSLSDKRFLNVCLDSSIKILPKKSAELGFFEIEVKGKFYKAFISQKSQAAGIEKTLESLTKISGFDAVAGMGALKQKLYEDIIVPISKSAEFEKFKISAPNGILLYGPPGCGKTYIVRKLSEEIKHHYFELRHSDFASIYVHGSVIKIGEIFDKAKASAPSLIFIDEIDGLFPDRADLGGNQQYKREEINEFLMRLNDAGKNKILVIGATNQINLIDKAVLRSGRFDKKILVPPPDFESRKQLFEFYTADRPVSGIDFDALSEKTLHYSCSDIELIVNEAARAAVSRSLPHLDNALLLEFISKTPSSLQETYL